MEEELSNVRFGLEVTLQETKGIFDYVSLSIRAEATSTERSWEWLAALPVCPDTSESHGNDCLFARHRTAMA